MIKRLLRRNVYLPLNTIEISRDNLIHNYHYLKSLNPLIEVAPVLKSNAYGHGIREIAKLLDTTDVEHKIPFFCVDSLYEAYQLLKINIRTPILIMGYTDPANLKVKKLPFKFAVFNLETCRTLNQYQPGCFIHIFVDTGMNREGIRLEELPKFLRSLKKFSNLKLEGVMSHFACADNLKDPLNKLQIKNFRKAIKIVRQQGFNPKYIHLANSGGLINYHKSLGFTNTARVGLALYGISNVHSRSGGIKPVLSLKTKIIQIKKLNKGEKVGYSGIFKAPRDTTLAVLPLGYYDGVDWRLQNKGSVLIDGIECQILGRVSMNITIIDISKIINPTVGQEVIVYSNNPLAKNSIQNSAKLCQTIPCDLLSKLASSTKRVIV